MEMLVEEVPGLTCLMLHAIGEPLGSTIRWMLGALLTQNAQTLGHAQIAWGAPENSHPILFQPIRVHQFVQPTLLGNVAIYVYTHFCLLGNAWEPSGTAWCFSAGHAQSLLGPGSCARQCQRHYPSGTRSGNVTGIGRFDGEQASNPKSNLQLINHL